VVKIAPSLLAADFTDLRSELDRIKLAGADLLHLDIMDGHFVPNLTFGPPIIKQIRKFTDLSLDAHLMVTNPMDYIEIMNKLGVEYLSFHPEVLYHTHRAINQIKELGMKAGIAINPGTPIDVVLPLIRDLDYVLFMSVNPGFGGQEFLSLVYEKIEMIDRIRIEGKLELEIEVDGGVTDKNAPELIKKGVDILVAGTYIFKSNDYRRRIDSLKNGN